MGTRRPRQRGAERHHPSLSPGPSPRAIGRHNHTYLDMAVAHAITGGVLDRQTIPAELLDHLARALAFYESQQTTS